MAPTQKDYEYFKANLSKICDGHIGEFVAIKDEQVLGYYKTFEDAVQETLKRFEAGTFIVQQCVNDISENSVVFHSRVYM